MDCLRAQQIVSDALDSIETDPEELAEAKSHCRECARCGAFVRAQLAVRDAGLPAPPEDLPDRVMARIRIEAAAKSPSAEPEVAAPGTPRSIAGSDPRPAEADVAPARSWTELAQRAWDPRNRRALIAWGSAAAVLFIAAGIGAIAGVRTILVPQRATETTVMGTINGDASGDYGAAESAPGTARDQAATTEQLQTGAASSASSFITVDGTVYRLIGPAAEVDEAALSRVGSTTTSLDSGGRELTYDVMSPEDPGRVFLEQERDEWLSFERVTRTYAGRLYVLRSADIPSFGEWPTLPDGIDEPSSIDGSPTFEPEGTDDAGTAIYRLRGSTADRGIALGPNPPAGDPLAGAPLWSWWEPAE